MHPVGCMQCSLEAQHDSLHLKEWKWVLILVHLLMGADKHCQYERNTKTECKLTNPTSSSSITMSRWLYARQKSASVDT